MLNNFLYDRRHSTRCCRRDFFCRNFMREVIGDIRVKLASNRPSNREMVDGGA